MPEQRRLSFNLLSVGHPAKRSWEQESQPEEKVKQPGLRKKMGVLLVRS